MAYRIKVSGIYNLETLNLLKMEGIAHFGIDLRPKSFNFLQHYVTLDVIKLLEVQDNLFLHFQDESSLIINKFLTDINDLILSSQTHILKKNINLEFSGLYNGKFWNEFAYPYYIKWDRDYDLSDLHHTEMCKGITIGVSLLKEYQARGEFYRFIDKLLKFKNQHKDFSIVLNLDEESCIFLSKETLAQNETIQGLQEMLLHCTANLINVTIGPMIEEQYRRPNYMLLKKIVNSSSNILFGD